MEFMLAVVGVVLLLSMTTLYMYLVEEDKVKPHVPTRIQHAQRGNFWGAEAPLTIFRYVVPIQCIKLIICHLL